VPKNIRENSRPAITSALLTRLSKPLLSPLHLAEGSRFSEGCIYGLAEIGASWRSDLYHHERMVCRRRGLRFTTRSEPRRPVCQPRLHAPRGPRRHSRLRQLCKSRRLSPAGSRTRAEGKALDSSFSRNCNEITLFLEFAEANKLAGVEFKKFAQAGMERRMRTSSFLPQKI